MIELEGDGGNGDGESGDVRNRVEILSADAVMNPESGLAGILEAGVIAFAFRTQGVGALEGSAGSVDGETVIVGDRNIFGAAAVLPAVVPVLVIAGTDAGLGLAEGTAELLAGAAVVGGLTVLVHGEAGVAEEIASGELGGVFGVSLIERNKDIAMIDVADGVVDYLDVIALVGDKGTFVDGNDLIGFLKDIEGDGGIGDVGGCGQLVERQAGDAIHEDVVLVAPVELVVLLIVLVGGGMNAQGAVGIVAGLVLRRELVFDEGFGIVLRGAGDDGRGIQADEGSVQNSHLIEPFDLRDHDLLQFAVLYLAQKTRQSPIGRQRARDVEAAVMGDEQVALKEVPKVSDLRKALALHDDERAQHSFFRKTLAPGGGAGQDKLYTAEELVVKRGDTLGCKQQHIPHDFLSVDRGHPLSVEGFWTIPLYRIGWPLSTLYLE